MRLILKGAGIKQAAVDRKMGVTPGMLNQYLNGTRAPSVEMAKKINNAVAAELTPDLRDIVSEYLSAVLSDGVVDAKGLTVGAVQGMGAAILAVRHYFRNSPTLPKTVLETRDDRVIRAFLAQERYATAAGLDVLKTLEPVQLVIEQAALRNDDDWLFKLVHEINLVWRRRVLFALRGTESPKRRLLIDEISELFWKYGVDIKPYLRTEAEMRPLRAREEAVIIIRTALARANPKHPLARYKLEAEIFNAVRSIVLASYDLSEMHWNKTMLEQLQGKL